MDESTRGVAAALQPYLRLIDSYASERLSSDEFESLFLSLYLNDETRWPREVFDILDGLFAEVDAYVGAPNVRADVIGAVSGDDMRIYAKDVRSRLNTVLTR